MKKVILFTIASKSDEKYATMLVNSIRKFHDEKELPISIVNEDWLNTIHDEQKFYRMTPFIAKDLLKEYEVVIKMDSDQIVTGKINHLWEDADFDVGTVLNGNPAEPPYTVWDIPPQIYMNCGLVVMRNKAFVDHWWKLCNSPYYPHYQFREQDLLNIMVHYGDYKVRCFDWSDKWHGLVSKGWWQYIEKRNDDRNLDNKVQDTFGEPYLVLPKEDRVWPVDGDKIIKVIHFAGGRSPDKMNYRIRFKPEIVKYLDELTHG